MAIGDGPTRQELLNQLATRLNKNPPPNMDPATEMRLVSYLNQRQRRLLTMPGLKRLRDATITFTTVPMQADYGLPSLAKVSRMWDPLQGRVLYEMSQQDSRLMAPSGNVNGTPEAFVWTGRQVVAQQPSAPTALFVQSSNAADTVTLVYVEGVVATGAAQSASIALNGTTPTNIAAAVSTWTRIDKFYLAAPTLGGVTLTAGAGGAVLAGIPVGQVTSVYSGFTLYPIPSAAITYSADITRPVTDLTHPTDQAAIPDDFADVLVLGALADEYQHLADPRWSAAMTEYKERENQLKYWLAETAIGRPFGLSRTWQRPSQLGSFFPSGT
jgi:hypothetical protein